MPGLCKINYTGKDGQIRQTAKWYGWATINGKKYRKPLATDRGVAWQLLIAWVKELEEQEHGLADPYKQHRLRPLAEHMDEWGQHLKAKARPTTGAQLQAGQTTNRARMVLLDVLKYDRISDIQASAVHSTIASFRDGAPVTKTHKVARKLSAQSLNFYLQSVKQFCKWLVRDRRSPTDPLLHLQGWNVQLDRRHDRRPLSAAETTWLLATTEQSPWTWRGLTGTDRAMIYRLALTTGLRKSEIASLQVGSFRLDHEHPHVRLQAAFAKNQQESDQPLTSETAEQLRDYLRGRGKDEYVWPFTDGDWSERLHVALQHDLAEGRQAYLGDAKAPSERREREDSSFLVYKHKETGEFADFHSLRHTFITNLARAGVHPKAAMDLARHSTIELTMSFYTHLQLHDRAAALDALPKLSPEPEQERKIG